MTDKQFKALRLANALEAAWSGTLHPTREAAAAELRRLYAINAQLVEALEHAILWEEGGNPEPSWVLDARAAILAAKENT